MATVVSSAVATPTADNRCVGGGGVVVEPPSSVVMVTAKSAASSGRPHRRLRRGVVGHKNDDIDDDDDPKASRSSTSSNCSSSLSSASSDEDDAAFGGLGGVVVVSADKSPSVQAAKRLKDLQQQLVDLDDLELLDRHLSNDGDDVHPDALHDNVTGMAAELRQKTKDLVLAARLGKALLVKNDELSLMNEQLAEEYGDKLEVL